VPEVDDFIVFIDDGDETEDEAAEVQQLVPDGVDYDNDDHAEVFIEDDEGDFCADDCSGVDDDDGDLDMSAGQDDEEDHDVFINDGIGDEDAVDVEDDASHSVGGAGNDGDDDASNPADGAEPEGPAWFTAADMGGQPPAWLTGSHECATAGSSRQAAGMAQDGVRETHCCRQCFHTDGGEHSYQCSATAFQSCHNNEKPQV
jgi:hypothetical protein